MCIERRFVPLGNTFLSDQQEQALIAAFEANRQSPGQESPVPTQQASPRSASSEQQARPKDVSAPQGSARRRSQSAPCSTSKVHEEEAAVEAPVEYRSLSLPILPTGEEPVDTWKQVEVSPAPLPLEQVSQILSTAPVAPTPSWQVSAPLEQPSNFICEHSPLHQQETNQMINFNAGVCTNVGDWGAWTTTMDPAAPSFMPAASIMSPPAPPAMAPPVHHGVHSPLQAPSPPPAHAPGQCHQQQPPASEMSLSPTAAGTRNRRRWTKQRTGTASHPHSPLMLSEILQESSNKDLLPPAAAETTHIEDVLSSITPIIIERLASGKSPVATVPNSLGEQWLAPAQDSVTVAGGAHPSSCKFEEKLSPAREMLRQRGKSLLMQCLRA